MPRFDVPTRDQVDPATQQAFDALQRALGRVPNIYATLAHSPTALPDYLALQNRRSSLAACPCVAPTGRSTWTSPPAG